MKRTLSLVLAVAMIITLLPTVAFAETTELPNQVFDFTQYNPENGLVPMLTTFN